jgi:hypothetical protein
MNEDQAMEAISRLERAVADEVSAARSVQGASSAAAQ